MTGRVVTETKLQHIGQLIFYQTLLKFFLKCFHNRLNCLLAKHTVKSRSQFSFQSKKYLIDASLNLTDFTYKANNSKQYPVSILTLSTTFFSLRKLERYGIRGHRTRAHYKLLNLQLPESHFNDVISDS